jgi:phosphoribosylformylglycinamidine synthase
MVRTNTVAGPGSDAAVLRLKETGQGLAISLDGNGRYAWLEPRLGARLAVAEASRNVSCTGARPIAATNCLNFGNPERPDIMWQFAQAVDGIAEGCRALGIPITGGNVSLYNETDGEAVYPTPVVGAVGLLEDVTLHCTSGFRSPGDRVVLLGAGAPGSAAASLAGSEFLELFHGRVVGQPAIDLDLERRVQDVCRNAIAQGLLSSAHDCSDGGLAVTLAECCIGGGVGMEVTAELLGRWDAALFGEGQSRIVVSVRPSLLGSVEELARRMAVPCLLLGSVGGDRLLAPGILDSPVAGLREVWDSGLERAVH